jgi:light-regulated signal transduction histidine kinase (bacteriophytochrome)
LQEPLRMVTSFTQLLQKRYSDKLDADANEFINFAVDGATRMKELIDNLLIFSRVASRDHKKMSLDLNTIIDNILIDFQNLIEEHRVKIIVNELPVIVSEKSLLILIFSNLISNAIKYNRAKELQIVISADYTDSEWTFSVADNGIGIEEKYYDKIFLIFQRLHGKKTYPGTGIGLAICKKSVEKLGGRIWVKSQLGKGSTFYFTIPQGGAID